MKETAFATKTTDKPIDKTWNELLESLGLKTGCLDLPMETTTSFNSTDELGIGMRLQTKGTAGTVRAATLTEFDPHNYSLNIRVFTTATNPTETHRNYHFSLKKTESQDRTQINFHLEMNVGLIGKLFSIGNSANSRLASTMLGYAT